MTPFSQKCGERQDSALKVGPHLLFKNLFDSKKHLVWILKKVVHLFFCVFQKKLKKAVNIF